MDTETNTATDTTSETATDKATDTETRSPSVAEPIVHEDGSVEINGYLFWPDYVTARLHKTRDRARCCWVMRWVKSPGRYITHFC